MGDWTPAAAAAIELCKRWAAEVVNAIPCDVYLFGSAIYEDGDQFDAQLSDLDLVVHFRDELDATQRARRMCTLHSLKSYLELQMIPVLHRTNCEEPGVSVLPVSMLEVQANIHKGKSRHFFDRNTFLDLIDDRESFGLPHAGTISISDEARQALEYVQEVRNQFLGISANGKGGLAPFDGSDPLPKALARSAAQLVPDNGAGSWYDTRVGLEYLFEELSRRRSESEELNALYRKVSIRRGGRGQRASLTDFDQLLLAEILYDRGGVEPAEPVATWEIRFVGSNLTTFDQARILAAIRRLAPDAEVLAIIVGSIIVRLRSSVHSFATVNRLYHLGALPAFMEVDEVEVRYLDGRLAKEGFAGSGIIDRVADRIEAWRPLSRDSFQTTEAKLADWLESWLKDSGDTAFASVAREAVVRGGSRPFRADILLQIPTSEADPRIVIEVVRLRSRRDFFAQLGRVQRIALPTILVLIGTADQLNGLEDDIQAVTMASGSLRVVRVLIDNG